MRREHRVAVAGHEHVEAAHVGLVDLEAGLVRHRLRLLVGALAQPDPDPAVGQFPAVGLGAAQVGLHHGAGGREVGAQPAEDLQGRVGGGVVLGVEGDRGAGLARLGADRAGVLVGELLVEDLARARRASG